MGLGWAGSVAVAARLGAGGGALMLLRRAADRDHVPGEVLAPERVLDAVAVDLARRVLGERVKRRPGERDLLGAVGPFSPPPTCRSHPQSRSGRRLRSVASRSERTRRCTGSSRSPPATASTARCRWSRRGRCRRRLRRCHHRVAAGAGRRGGGDRVAVRPAGRERERGDQEGDDGQCCGAAIGVHAR
jgi:hypothetical protein